MQLAEITVVIPHRNCNELLPAAIASIRTQDVPADIIVVDNASDVTPQVEGVTLLRHDKDEGIPVSLNDGYKWAVTEYCCLLGADDTFADGWFRTALALFDANPHIAFVSPGGSRQLSWPDILDENYMHMGAMFRRAVVLENGGYRHVPFFDWDLWMRLAKAGINGISIANHFYNWNRREGSDSTRWNGADYERFVAQLREEHTR